MMGQCQMNVLLIAMAAAGVSGQPAQMPADAGQPTQIIVFTARRVEVPLSEDERLRQACNSAVIISDRLHDIRVNDPQLTSALAHLNDMTCGEKK